MVLPTGGGSEADGVGNFRDTNQNKLYIFQFSIKYYYKCQFYSFIHVEVFTRQLDAKIVGLCLDVITAMQN